MGTDGAYTRKRVPHFRLFTALCSVMVMTLFSIEALAHGYMIYPPSRALEHLDGNKKAWPIAGIKAKFRREPCLGIQQNASLTAIEAGPLKLTFMFPNPERFEHYDSCADLNANGAIQESFNIPDTSKEPLPDNLDIAIAPGHLQQLLSLALVNGGLQNADLIKVEKRQIEALLLNLGYAYLQANDPEAAEPLLRMSLIIDPGRENA